MARNTRLEAQVLRGESLGKMTGGCKEHTLQALAVVAWNGRKPDGSDCVDDTLVVICDGYEPKPGGAPRVATQQIALGETLQGIDLTTEMGRNQCAVESQCALATWCLNNCKNAETQTTGTGPEPAA